MIKTHTKDGIEYVTSNTRMRYNPEFHENHGKPWSTEDLAYMCSSWDAHKKADIAMAVGRTHTTILTKVHKLRKSGQFEHYKKLGDSYTL